MAEEVRPAEIPGIPEGVELPHSRGQAPNVEEIQQIAYLADGQGVGQ